MIVVLIYGIIQVDAGQHVKIGSLKRLKNLGGKLGKKEYGGFQLDV